MRLEKVLIVEDEIAVAALVYRTFENEWTQIHHASNVFDAVKLIESGGNNYDFILLDAHLGVGERTRDKALDTIVTIRSASNAPIVVHTGDIILAEELEADEGTRGVYGVIRKGSVQKHRIVDVIEKAIAKWEVERWNRALEVYREEKTRFRRAYLGK